MDTLVDSNVIIDILVTDSPWKDWSSLHLQAQAGRGRLVINPVIYAEVSLRFPDQATLDAALNPNFFRRDPLPWEAAFMAAKCHQRYRSAGGGRAQTLPDFFIGAHAAVAGIPLLTRDNARYRTYFPQIELISP